MTNEEIGKIESRGEAFNVQVGGGLFLEVRPTGHKGWKFRYFMAKEIKKSLGTFPEISIEKAIEMAKELRQNILEIKCQNRISYRNARKRANLLKRIERIDAQKAELLKELGTCL